MIIFTRLGSTGKACPLWVNNRLPLLSAVLTHHRVLVWSSRSLFNSNTNLWIPWAWMMHSLYASIGPPSFCASSLLYAVEFLSASTRNLSMTKKPLKWAFSLFSHYETEWTQQTYCNPTIVSWEPFTITAGSASHIIQHPKYVSTLGVSVVLLIAQLISNHVPVYHSRLLRYFSSLFRMSLGTPWRVYIYLSSCASPILYQL